MSYLEHLTNGTGRILMLGCGYVSAATQAVLLQTGVDPRRLTIVDADDRLRTRARAAVRLGARWHAVELRPDNLESVLDELTDKGEDTPLVINLTTDVDTGQYLRWCASRGVASVDTSVELWDPYVAGPPATQTLAYRHAQLRREMAAWNQPEPWPTMVVEHGANPGWVSHATRAALGQYLARYRTRLAPDDAMAADAAWERGDHARVAQALGIRVIQIAERDTQITGRPREIGEFVNTWSVAGLRSEGAAPAAAWLGTHDRLPPGWRYVFPDSPADRAVYGPRPGVETWVRSCVPPASGPQFGHPIDHGEVLSMGRSLTVHGEDGQAVYAPSIMYAYWLPDAAVASLVELRAAGYAEPARTRIMTRDIVSGADHLGVLLLGEHGGLWHGSCLDIFETRRLLGSTRHNATTLQVAGAVVAAAAWALANPDRGLCTADDIQDWRRVLDDTAPWLGPMPSIPVDWTPLDGPHSMSDTVIPRDRPWSLDALLA